jgi:hypothetical protein
VTKIQGEIIVMKNIKKTKLPFLSNRSGASYAISAVVITATTIALVLVASTFAYQTLDQQRGTSEFNIAKNSLFSFDDGLRDVAWSLKGSRNTRFAIDYGKLTLFPDNAEYGLDLNVNVEIDGFAIPPYKDTTGYVVYSIPQKYLTYRVTEPYYILGDEQLIVTEGTADLGRLLVSQESGWVNSFLSYRIRVMETSTITLSNDTTLSYVNVLIIKMKISDFSDYVGELDLTAKAADLSTISYESTVGINKQCIVSAQLGDQLSEISIDLNPNCDKVVVNFLISEMEVSP